MPDYAESQVTEATDVRVSARTRVFGTTELFEHILLDTPARSGKPWFQDDDNVLRQISTRDPACWFWPDTDKQSVCFYVDEELAKLIGFDGRESLQDDDEATVRRRMRRISLLGSMHELHEPARRLEASWRRMLIHHPRVEGDTIVTGLTSIVVRNKVHSRALSVAKSAGRDRSIRMGELWDAAVEDDRIITEEIRREKGSRMW
ncbi:hypothetical protein LTR56_026409 [Elasticomyces elasticus]|nr:hypothetical protein LTR56_026409 [Elasticomyces elasticus]KAK3618067.1 hypothetical protein LTR22_026504 [Elasticomyces elasticus]KAK4902416.1 hypothetical protein LTR49_027063 [Elasticomyces elasticus]KAK5736759.1 hypothetical protein LTS12_026097 [Elasticomyces elasticus]